MQELEHHTLRFNGFTLDLTRGCLMRGNHEVKLRPKSLATLQYLVENRGRLISKDELIEVVWAGAAVTDNSLVQCLSEVREALDDHSQRYIRTVPRRGYIFEERVEEGDLSTAVVNSEEIGGLKLVTHDDEEASAEEISTERIRQPPTTRIWPTSIIRGEVNKKVVASSLLAAAIIAVVTYLLVSTRSATPQTIAVLPFKPLSQDSRDEYLELGMADALITKLSNIKQVIVRPTSAVRKYAEQRQDAVTSGRELGVQTVLEGSLQKLGDRVRVTVQLISVSDGRPLWAEQFDEKFTDIFAVQDKISERITNALSLRLTGNERQLLAKRYTENTEAYQLYLRGRYFWEKRTRDGLLKAIEYFEQAIAADPDYALAHAGVAHSYGPLAYLGYISPREATPKMRAAATKALELDDTLAEAHTAMGAVKAFHEWDWAAGESEFKRAIDLNPNYATAYQWYGLYLEALGRHEENLAARKRALEIDPFNLSINWAVATVFYHARQYDKAIELFQRTLELDPTFVLAHHGLGQCYEQKQMYDAAIEEFQKSLTLPGNVTRSKAFLAHAYAVAGRIAEANKIEKELQELASTQYVSSYDIALIYAGLGETNQALASLEKAYAEGDPPLNHIAVEPRFDTLRVEPRFRDLLRRMHLAL